MPVGFCFAASFPVCRVRKNLCLVSSMLDTCCSLLHVGVTECKDSFTHEMHSFKSPRDAVKAQKFSLGLCCLLLAVSYNTMGVSRAASILASRVSGVIHALLCARSSSRLKQSGQASCLVHTAYTILSALASSCMQLRYTATSNPNSNEQA